MLDRLALDSLTPEPMSLVTRKEGLSTCNFPVDRGMVQINRVIWLRVPPLSTVT